MGDEELVEKLKNEAIGKGGKISVYDEIRIFLTVISKNIVNYEWGKALDNINGLHSILLSILLNRGIDASVLNSMFDELIDTVKSDYDTIGNDSLKRDDCLKQLNEIVNYIGNIGIYIGQQKVTIYNYVDVLNEKVKELTRIFHDAQMHPSIRDNFIMTCEFLRDNVIPYVDVPSEMVRYRIIEALNTLISALPFQSKSSATVKDFENAFATLRNYVDIVMLSNKNPEFKKFFDEHKEEFESATLKQIEKIVERVVKKVLVSSGGEGTGGEQNV